MTSYVITATDSNGTTYNGTITLTVNPIIVATIAYDSNAYSYTENDVVAIDAPVITTNGAITSKSFAISPSLSGSGLTLNTSDGSISGTVNVLSQTSYTVTMTYDGQTTSDTFTIEAIQGGIVVPTGNLVLVFDAKNYVGSGNWIDSINGYSMQLYGAGAYNNQGYFQAPKYGMTTAAIPNVSGNYSFTHGVLLRPKNTGIFNGAVSFNIGDENGGDVLIDIMNYASNQLSLLFGFSGGNYQITTPYTNTNVYNNWLWLITMYDHTIKTFYFYVNNSLKGSAVLNNFGNVQANPKYSHLCSIQANATKSPMTGADSSYSMLYSRKLTTQEMTDIYNNLVADGRFSMT